MLPTLHSSAVCLQVLTYNLIKSAPRKRGILRGAFYANENGTWEPRPRICNIKSSFILCEVAGIFASQICSGSVDILTKTKRDHQRWSLLGGARNGTSNRGLRYRNCKPKYSAFANPCKLPLAIRGVHRRYVHINQKTLTKVSAF